MQRCILNWTSTETGLDTSKLRTIQVLNRKTTPQKKLDFSPLRNPPTVCALRALVWRHLVDAVDRLGFFLGPKGDRHSEESKDPALSAAISTEYFNCWISLANCLVRSTLAMLFLVSDWLRATWLNFQIIIFVSIWASGSICRLIFLGQRKSKPGRNTQHSDSNCKPFNLSSAEKELRVMIPSRRLKRYRLNQPTFVEFCQFPSFPHLQDLQFLSQGLDGGRDLAMEQFWFRRTSIYI